MHFAELGQDVQLTATIPKRFTNYQNAELSLALARGGTARLFGTRVRLTNGAGTCRWKATGLEPADLSAVVDVTWTGLGLFSNRTVLDQVFVYRSQVELLAVDDNDQAIEGAVYKATMRVHPQYSGEVGQVQLSGQTDSQGRAVIANLPPLESLEIRWKNPNLLSNWVTADGFTEYGAKRKAALQANYRAQLVGVTANESLTRYVNVPRDADDSGAGRLVTIRAKVHPQDGGGRAGDRIWARVKWHEDNCTRIADAPRLEGQSLVELAGRNLTEYVVEKQLGADGGEVVFNFECGVAGGDRFSLWVGGDQYAEDDGPVLITTKRKLRLEPYFPPGYPNADKLFCQDFKNKLKRALEVAEIELEIAEPQDISYPAGQGEYEPKQVSAEVAAKLGWDREVHFVYTHEQLFLPLPPTFRKSSDYPTIRAFFVDGFVQISASGQPFTVEGMTEPQSGWITAGDNSTGFLPCDLDGKSMLTAFSPAKPAKEIYEYIYLWDVESGTIISDPLEDHKPTDVWVFDEATIAQETHPEGKPCKVYRAALRHQDEVEDGLTVVRISQAGFPVGCECPGGYYAKKIHTGTEPAVAEQWGEWRTADGNHGPITDDNIVIDTNGAERYKRFRLQLPDEAQVSRDNPATVTVGLKTMKGGIAGKSSGCAIILINRGGEPSDKIAQALLHEIGHSLGQSWSTNANPPAGVRFDRKYLYGSSVTNSRRNRGHQGPHCAFGLPDQYLDDSQDYHNLLTNDGLHGSCVMFGGIGPRTVYSEQTRQFCRNCLPTIKAEDLSKIGDRS